MKSLLQVKSLLHVLRRHAARYWGHTTQLGQDLDSKVSLLMYNMLLYPVLPSRSSLSDLGLLSDLFENMLLNWSSFCLKSPLFGLKNPKSLFSPVQPSVQSKKDTYKFS